MTKLNKTHVIQVKVNFEAAQTKIKRKAHETNRKYLCGQIDNARRGKNGHKFQFRK